MNKIESALGVVTLLAVFYLSLAYAHAGTEYPEPAASAVASDHFFGWVVLAGMLGMLLAIVFFKIVEKFFTRKP